jgi:hypothetical protein
MTYSLHKVCAVAGCKTRVYGVGIFCAKCFSQTPEGKRQKQQQEQRRRYEIKESNRIASGLPAPAVHCSRCIHWHQGCCMGFPEGIGSFAEECAVFSVTAIDLDLETNHPDVQEMVQERLDRAYELAGRSDPAHPFFSRYTGVFDELHAKGIPI